MNFKKGDRIKVIKNSRHLINKTGTVLASSFGIKLNLAIEFDENVEGHSCYGLGKPGFCYYLSDEKVELIENSSLNILNDNYIQI